MKNLLITMITLWTLLAITSSAYALPTRIYTDLPTGVYGRYYPDRDTIYLSRKTPEKYKEHVRIHETAHWYDMENKTVLQRRFWQRAFEREQYKPTEYCQDTTRNVVEECYAESLTIALLYNELPPEGTTTRRIIERDLIKFKEILSWDYYLKTIKHKMQ